MPIVSLRNVSILAAVLTLAALTAGAAPTDAETAAVEGGDAADKPRGGRRPVLAPGQSAPAAPPPSVTRPAVQKEEPEGPAEPAAPLEFADEAALGGIEPPAEEVVGGEEITDPAEVRYLTRKGNLHVEMSVRPGIPQPGEPVVIGWLLQEHLHIPDPYLGDRKPLSGVDLVVTVGGPEANRVYELHPTGRPGAYGFTFTPHASGVYGVHLARRDGRAGYEAEMQLPVGQPPLASSRNLEVRRIARAPQAPDDFGATMRELGRRWIRLERAAGTPAAAQAHADLLGFAESLRDGAPEKARPAFAGMVQAIASIPTKGSRQAILSRMDEVNFQSCLRCHAVGRFEFAEDVSAWPAYRPNPDLKPPVPTGGGRSPRGPVRPVRQ